MRNVPSLPSMGVGLTIVFIKKNIFEDHHSRRIGIKVVFQCISSGLKDLNNLRLNIILS